MIEKGRSNNTSLYVLLGIAVLVLAGAAYGIFHFFFSGAKEAPQPAAQPAATAPAAPGKDATTGTAANTKANPDAAKKATPDKDKPAAKQEATKQETAKKGAPATAPQQNYSILIKKSEFMLYVLKDGKVVESFGCALGKGVGDKQKSGDNKTPDGTFRVAEIDDASYWTHDFKDGKGEIKGAYGPWFFYLDTSAKSGGQWDGIGIHGTHDPSSIGTRASEGCIRLLNQNVQTLKQKYIRVGTQVTIEE